MCNNKPKNRDVCACASSSRNRGGNPNRRRIMQVFVRFSEVEAHVILQHPVTVTSFSASGEQIDMLGAKT